MTDLVTETRPRWTLTPDIALPEGSIDPSATLSSRYHRERQFQIDRSASPTSDPDGSTWPEPALSRLEELAGLLPGWDGGAASTPSPAVLAAVREFVLSDLVASLQTKPDLVPTVEGGILIEWHTEAVDLIIEPSVSGAAGSYYFCDNETGEEVEETLGGPTAGIAAAFIKLGFRP